MSKNKCKKYWVERHYNLIYSHSAQILSTCQQLFLQGQYILYNENTVGVYAPQPQELFILGYRLQLDCIDRILEIVQSSQLISEL